MRSNWFELEITRLAREAMERHRVGTVSTVVGSRLTVITTGGAQLTVPRLSTWTPVAGDIVLLAITPAGWIAIGKILP